MIFLRTQYICKLAGKFSALLSLALIALSAYADREPYNFNPVAKPKQEWTDFKERYNEKDRLDRIDGLSYVISGSIALVGGLVGQAASSDPLEKGVYTLFQTIGVASIGYGVFRWKLGDDERWIYQTARNAPGLSDADRAAVMRSYFDTKRLRGKDERFVRALTHGLIAALNFYGATQQKNESLKNALVFLGSVNTLATISYTF